MDGPLEMGVFFCGCSNNNNGLRSNNINGLRLVGFGFRFKKHPSDQYQNFVVSLQTCENFLMKRCEMAGASELLPKGTLQKNYLGTLLSS